LIARRSASKSLGAFSVSWSKSETFLLADHFLYFRWGAAVFYAQREIYAGDKTRRLLISHFASPLAHVSFSLSLLLPLFHIPLSQNAPHPAQNSKFKFM
jgi:hypothetical protein